LEAFQLRASAHQIHAVLADDQLAAAIRFAGVLGGDVAVSRSASHACHDNQWREGVFALRGQFGTRRWFEKNGANGEMAFQTLGNGVVRSLNLAIAVLINRSIEGGRCLTGGLLVGC
jgi:hypothetical protein